MLRSKGSAVFSVAFSPDGKTLAWGTQGDGVRIWDVASRTGRRSLMENENYMFAVAFSPDGKKIASGGEYSRLRLWDAESGKELADLPWHEKGVSSVAFSPPGHGRHGDRYPALAPEDAAAGAAHDLLLRGLSDRLLDAALAQGARPGEQRN
jgi:WD40 repeat protein